MECLRALIHLDDIYTNVYIWVLFYSDKFEWEEGIRMLLMLHYNQLKCETPTIPFLF
ncbi:hypothetical protein MTTB_09460 [Methanothermobacter tenebrarum]|uniref:Uncharacterized protein n=1 Tax=Methanothermobacter tenebrarum TaxID=680118 RepID=A0ABM7YBM3_9EURY|nr:hypothetical protein MTTB_09460 [Methanothermobacter tenebrarum]